MAALYTGDFKCGWVAAVSKDRVAGLSAGVGTAQPVSYETESRKGKNFSQQTAERDEGGEAGEITRSDARPCCRHWSPLSRPPTHQWH